jgi:hypothetical protein
LTDPTVPEVLRTVLWTRVGAAPRTGVRLGVGGVVLIDVGVLVEVSVAVDVDVGVLVEVLGGGVCVGVRVGVDVCMGVLVDVAVAVGVGVLVEVGVPVGVSVLVGVGDAVGVGVLVGVADGGVYRAPFEDPLGPPPSQTSIWVPDHTPAAPPSRSGAGSRGVHVSLAGS